jgi:NADH:ubiquinone oxidoreductase subunit 4 (subunit M)
VFLNEVLASVNYGNKHCRELFTPALVCIIYMIIMETIRPTSVIHIYDANTHELLQQFNQSATETVD